MACIALHKCDHLFPRNIYYLLFWNFPCLKFLCDDILWVVLQVNAQSGHDKASLFSTKSGIYISILSPRICIVRVNPGSFLFVACLACLPVNETMMPINILHITIWFIYEKKNNIKNTFWRLFIFLVSWHSQMLKSILCCFVSQRITWETCLARFAL